MNVFSFLLTILLNIFGISVYIFSTRVSLTPVLSQLIQNMFKNKIEKNNFVSRKSGRKQDPDLLEAFSRGKCLTQTVGCNHKPLLSISADRLCFREENDEITMLTPLCMCQTIYQLLQMKFASFLNGIGI